MVGSPEVFVAVVIVILAAARWWWRRDPAAPRRRFFRLSRVLALVAALFLFGLAFFEHGTITKMHWTITILATGLLVAASIAEWVYNLHLRKRRAQPPASPNGL